MSAMTSSMKMERPSSLELGKQKTRVSFNEESISSSRRLNRTASESVAQSAAAAKKFKLETEFRSRRKRTNSWSFSWDHINNKRRRASMVLPSKFLLGGNITDPLNLEALDKEELATNEEANHNGNLKRGGTVRVIIPPNINDPLNLDACSEDGDELLADAIFKQRRRRKPRKRKRRNSEPTVTSCTPDLEDRLSTSWEENVDNLLKESKNSFASPPSGLEKSVLSRFTAHIYGRQMSEPPIPVCRESEVPMEKVEKDCQPQQEQQSPSKQQQVIRPNVLKKFRPKGDDKIVSPVIPQPGVERKRHLSHQRHHTHHVDKPSYTNVQPRNMNVQPPKNYNPKNFKFHFGNYNQYYGYRNPEQKVDPRLKYMKKEWFEGKDVLDIGCNIGHITLSVARNYAPRKVMGIDIDKKLINIAKKNIKHYFHINSSEESEFPKSMRLLYGPLKPPINKDGWPSFPHNVTFYQGNYVLENDALLETIRPEFDVVLCLSVTKWIHLNWGDGGLKRFFKRIHSNLRPEGILILEPQAWPSYTKKRKVTPEIFENYKNIKLYPDKFAEYLTKEVGFTFLKKVVFAHHYSKGFQRPIFLYRKDTFDKKPVSEESSSFAPSESVDGQQSATFSEASEQMNASMAEVANPLSSEAVNEGSEVTMEGSSPHEEQQSFSEVVPSNLTAETLRGTKRSLDSHDEASDHDSVTSGSAIKRTKCDNVSCGNKKLKLDICEKETNKDNRSETTKSDGSDKGLKLETIELIKKLLTDKEQSIEALLFQSMEETEAGQRVIKRRKSI